MDNKVVCSGALIYAKSTGRILLLQKASGKHKGTWGLVGGKNTELETAWQGLQREVLEEIGYNPEFSKVIPLESFISNDNKFNFHTYLCVLDSEFIPHLSSEHFGWSWSTLANCPQPLHRGLKHSLLNHIIKTKLQTVFDVINLL